MARGSHSWGLVTLVVAAASCTSLLGNDFEIVAEAPPGSGGAATTSTTTSAMGGSGAGGPGGSGGSAGGVPLTCAWQGDLAEVASLAGLSTPTWGGGAIQAVPVNNGLRVVLERGGDLDVFLVGEGGFADEGPIAGVGRVYEFKRVSGTAMAALVLAGGNDLNLLVWDNNTATPQSTPLIEGVSLDDFEAAFVPAAAPVGTFIPEVVVAATGRFAANNGPFELRFHYWDGTATFPPTIFTNPDNQAGPDDFEFLGLFRAGDDQNVVFLGPPFDGASTARLFHVADDPTPPVAPVAEVAFGMDAPRWLAPAQRLDGDLVLATIRAGAQAQIRIGTVDPLTVPADADGFSLNEADPIPLNDAPTSVRLSPGGLVMVGPRNSAQAPFGFVAYDLDGRMLVNDTLPLDALPAGLVEVTRAYANPRDVQFAAFGGPVDVVVKATYDPGGVHERLFHGTLFCEFR